jgi:hypothetical protein
MMGARRHRAGLTAALALAVACEPVPVPDDAGTVEAGAFCVDGRDCDDGVFCNGLELCYPALDGRRCFPGSSPCVGVCDESGGGCGSCTPADADGDGYEALGCGGLDCDDTRAGVAPGRTETCDPAGIDEDCRPSSHGILDADGDGYTSSRCCNGDRCGPDCDDAQSSIGPGAPEACNGIDEDCDGVIDEGAELACTLPGAEVASCIDGRCAPLRCAEGRDDCDGRASNGCEADLRWDASACGGCDAPCSAGQSCADGVCVQICGPSFHNCPEGCVPNWSELSCGDRCDPCPAPTNGLGVCIGASCALTCEPWAELRDDPSGLRCVSTDSRVPFIAVDGVSQAASPGRVATFRVAGATATVATELEPFVVDRRTRARLLGEERAIGEAFAPVPLALGTSFFELEGVAESGAISSYPLAITRGYGAELTATVPLTVRALAMDGDLLVVGAPDAGGGGAVFVYRRIAGAWGTATRVSPSLAHSGMHFGASVDVVGNTIAVGAPAATGPTGEIGAGAVFLFEVRGSDIVQIELLGAPFPDPSDAFGVSVSLRPGALLIGAPGDDGNGVGLGGDPGDDARQNAGAAYLFRADPAWRLEAYIKSSNPVVNAEFGRAVALGDATLVVQQSGTLATYRRVPTLAPVDVVVLATDFALDASGLRLVTTRTDTLTVLVWSEAGWLREHRETGVETASSIDGDRVLAVDASIRRAVLRRRGTGTWSVEAWLDGGSECTPSLPILGALFGDRFAVACGNSLAVYTP